MAYTKPITEWKSVWYFPFLQRREIGLYLSSAPGVPVDVNSFWNEYRWTFKAQKEMGK